MFCTWCNHPLENETVTCPRCGFRVTEASMDEHVIAEYQGTRFDAIDQIFREMDSAGNSIFKSVGSKGVYIDISENKITGFYRNENNSSNQCSVMYEEVTHVLVERCTFILRYFRDFSHSLFFPNIEQPELVAYHVMNQRRKYLNRYKCREYETQRSNEKTKSLTETRNYALSIDNLYMAYFAQAYIVSLAETSQFSHEKRDSVKIAFLILGEIIDHENSQLNDCLLADIRFALFSGNTRKRQELLSQVGFLSNRAKEYQELNVDILRVYLLGIEYMYEEEGKNYNVFVESVIQLFDYRYQHNIWLRAKYLMHIIFEGVMKLTPPYGIALYERYKKDFFGSLNSDLAFCESIILVLAMAISEKDFSKADILLKDVNWLFKNRKQDIYSDYFFAKALYCEGLILECKDERNMVMAISLYQKAVDLMDLYRFSTNKPDDIDVAVNYSICAFYLAKSLYITGEIGEALTIAENGIELFHSNNHERTYIYYQLLQIRGAIYTEMGDLHNARIALSEVTNIGVNLTGKENDVYILSLINYCIVLNSLSFLIDNSEKLDEALHLAKMIKDELCITWAYNAMSQFGIYTDRWQDCERYARLALEHSKNYSCKDTYLLKCYLLLALSAQILTRKYIKAEADSLYTTLKKGYSDCSEKERQLFDIAELNYFIYTGKYQIAISMLKSIRNQYKGTLPSVYFQQWLAIVRLLWQNQQQYQEALEELKQLTAESVEQAYSPEINEINGVLDAELYLSIYISLLLKMPKETQTSYGISSIISYAKMIKMLLIRYQRQGRNNNHSYSTLVRKLAALETRLLLTKNQREKDSLINEIGEVRYQIDLHEVPKKAIHFYSLEKLGLKIPENAIVIETYCFYDINWDSDEPITSTKLKTAFFLGVPNANNPLGYDYIKYKETSFDDLTALSNDLHSLLSGETPETDIKNATESIRKKLYNVIISPIEKYIKTGTTIYFAVDNGLAIIPLETLIDRSGHYLGDNFTIIYLDAACQVSSDINLRVLDKKPLIIGNPTYSTSYMYKDTNQLAWSEFEANAIAEHYGAHAFVGRKARKGLIEGNIDYPFIHISSHGTINLSEAVGALNLPMVGSYILFAGYDDWLHGNVAADYSNGMLSAEEITHRDFSCVNLAVLSACETALGYNMDTVSPKGIRWALHLAGVKASITALWSVDDFCTAVFMILFYQNLDSSPIGEALHLAKKQFQLLTFAKMDKNPSLRNLKYQYSLRGLMKDDKIFSDIRNWSAFVYYLNGRDYL